MVIWRKMEMDKIQCLIKDNEDKYSNKIKWEMDV